MWGSDRPGRSEERETCTNICINMQILYFNEASVSYSLTLLDSMLLRRLSSKMAKPLGGKKENFTMFQGHLGNLPGVARLEGD